MEKTVPLMLPPPEFLGFFQEVGTVPQKFLTQAPSKVEFQVVTLGQAS